MNRAHAYKAARDANREAGKDEDAGINMGLYNYPVLMAVDILINESDVVPVGRDQVQHVEVAADIAGSFNHVYGRGYRFKIPEAIVPEAEVAQTLPGLDGRKMSKSYDNTIPLFAPPPADVVASTRKELEAGQLGWGQLKDRLFHVLDEQLAPMRKRYEALMDHDSELDDLLAAGAERERKRTTRVLQQVRDEIGI